MQTHLLSAALGVLVLLAYAQPAGAYEQQSTHAKENWRNQLTGLTENAMKDIDELTDIAWRGMRNRLGLDKTTHIAAYRGYGNSEKVWITGRLLRNEPYGGPLDDDTWWDNLVATYKRWNSHEVPNAEVELSFARKSLRVTTDKEGFYHAEIDRPRRFVEADVSAVYRTDTAEGAARHKIALLNPEAQFVVISDIDDTLIHTGITDLKTAAKLTFLNNAKTRKPLAGAASLYQSLARGVADKPVNPMFYLSNSAWNMYDLLRDFMTLNDFPFGPLLLRDIGLTTDSSNHKRDSLKNLATRFDLPIILIGDSGQHDAQYYAEFVEQYGERLKGVYIRDIDPDFDSEYDTNVDAIIDAAREHEVPFLRVRDSVAIAQHANANGWIRDADVERIVTDVERDLQREALD